MAGGITWARPDGSLILLKYDPSGHEMWRALYDGPASGGDELRGLVVDGAGNAHVVCDSDGIATLKYSPSGEQLWVRHHDSGLGLARESADGVAVDSAGNVYVAGYGKDEDDEFDLITLKYSAEGELLWVRRKDGLEAVGEGSPGRDYAAGIGLDGNEKVVVIATCEPIDGTPSTIVTLTYDPEGNILWASKDLGPSGEAARVSAMVIATGGDIFLVGSTEPPSGERAYLTIRKDPSGKTLWKKVYDGDSEGEGFQGFAKGIAVDPNGNVVVTGHYEGTGEYLECATVKYAPDGTRLWAARYGAGLKGDHIAFSLGVDGTANVYVGGRSHPSALDHDWFVLKYDSTGSLRDSFQLDGECEFNSQDQWGGLLVDSAGEFYATGSIWTDRKEQEILTVKVDASLSEVWRARAEGMGYHDDACTAMTLDGSGNVIMAGSSMGEGGQLDYATVKFDPSGRQVWVARFGSLQGDDGPSAIAADADGSVVVTGAWDYGPSLACSVSELGTVKYDRDGDELWRAVRPMGEYPAASRIAIDGQGTIWIAGGAGHTSWSDEGD